MQRVFDESTVTGVIAVLESEGKNYSYGVTNGKVDFL